MGSSTGRGRGHPPSARARARRIVVLLGVGVALTSAASVSAAAPSRIGPAGPAQEPDQRADPAAPDPAVDCRGPVDDAAPGTPEWDELNAANAQCARERHQDKPAHRVLARTAPADAYREPARHDGVRFRYDTTTIGGLDAEVYRPCTSDTCDDLPDDLDTFEPPYPAAVIFHGGGANRSLYWWASQGRRVAVVGGGNVAVDAVRTARRLGAELATLVYRRSKAEMPARVEEVRHAQEEGIRFELLASPVAVEGRRASRWA